MNYILVEWPESQMLMAQYWFKTEAVLHPDLSAAYFIPEQRFINNEYILDKSEDLALLLEHTPEEENHMYNEWASEDPFGGSMNTFESILNLKLSLIF